MLTLLIAVCLINFKTCRPEALRHFCLTSHWKLSLVRHGKLYNISPFLWAHRTHGAVLQKKWNLGGPTDPPWFMVGWSDRGPSQFWVVCQLIIYWGHEINERIGQNESIGIHSGTSTNSHIDDLVQNCSVSCALVMEILQSSIKLWILYHVFDIITSAELSVHFYLEIFSAKHTEFIGRQTDGRTIHGRTLGRRLDLWVAFGDWATVFQQHWLRYDLISPSWKNNGGTEGPMEKRQTATGRTQVYRYTSIGDCMISLSVNSSALDHGMLSVSWPHSCPSLTAGNEMNAHISSPKTVDSPNTVMTLSDRSIVEFQISSPSDLVTSWLHDLINFLRIKYTNILWTFIC